MAAEENRHRFSPPRITAQTEAVEKPKSTQAAGALLDRRRQAIPTCLSKQANTPIEWPRRRSFPSNPAREGSSHWTEQKAQIAAETARECPHQLPGLGRPANAH